MYTYRAVFTPTEKGSLLVTYPDVDGAITEGADNLQARAMGSEALGIMLRHHADANGALPAANATDGIPIEPGLADSLQIAVILAFVEAGIDKGELARRLGRQEVHARRILDPDHTTTIGTLERDLEALGKRAWLVVKAV